MKMKNKRAEQKALKAAHRERLRATKKQTAAQNFQRPAATRSLRQRFLIVCEGEKTEPDYFNYLRRHFRLTTVEVKIVKAAGNTLQLVEKAYSLAQQDTYDHIWVVFDKDDFPPDRFNQAIAKARQLGYGAAYSNQSFEYWLLLHFEDHQGGPMPRSDYLQKLNHCLKPHGLSLHAKGLSPACFHLLVEAPVGQQETRMVVAITRAKGILRRHEGKAPADAESSTTVFELVEQLLSSATS